MLSTLCAGLGSGAVVDSAHRRIPNGISLGTAVTGLVLAATGMSGVTFTSALAGFFIGFLLMLPGHLFGATGAGDVKLFAAAGTLLGAGHVVPAFLLTAIAGGVLALGVAWWRGRLGRTMSLTARLFGRPAAMKADIESPGEHNRFPYGPAIAVGCVLAALI
ncbi:MAG: A24 family peptidase [Vicinamibacterales bacterium]|nr:A24 family peptidase [Vicinamibacterales bacterium]